MHNEHRKALVAEDDRALADIVRLALARSGYDVCVAHDGQKALQLARSKCFDLIVSDYQMPLLNGEQFLSGVRADGASQSAMLILCSAKAYELDSERLRDELDLWAVFYKPFSLSDLVKTVDSCIPLQDIAEGTSPTDKATATERAAEDSPGSLSEVVASINCYLPSSRLNER